MIEPITPGSQPVYDSKAEAEAASEFQRLGCVRLSKPLAQEFTDAEGASFTAKADWIHAASGCILEFKASNLGLNGRGSKAIADRALAKQEVFRIRRGQSLLPIDRLNSQWNHALARQVAVQSKLGPLNFVVVFRDPPSGEQAAKYVGKGLVFCPLSALPSYLAWARLAKHSLSVGFTLSSSASETPEPLALGIGVVC